MRRVPIRRGIVRKNFAKLKRNRKKFGNLDYLAWLKTWPCFVCFKEHCERHAIPFWDACRLPEARALFRTRSLEICGETQAAHVGPKGTAQRCPDREAMPLGARHHLHPTMGGFPDSHHAGTKTFWHIHKLNRWTVFEFLRGLYVEETGREV